jgi:hypothetical protein
MTYPPWHRERGESHWMMPDEVAEIMQQADAEAEVSRI